MSDHVNVPPTTLTAFHPEYTELSVTSD